MKRDYQALAGKPIGLSLEVLSNLKSKMAGVTGLEPAASGVTGRRSNQLSYTRANHAAQAGGNPPDLPGPGTTMHRVARVTGLEPATSGVTGRHSNQLSYTRVSGRNF